MLCDDAKCLDCCQYGCDCTCEHGPSWSPERKAYEAPHRFADGSEEMKKRKGA